MTDIPETTDILERLLPLPDRLAKEALDEIKRLRGDAEVARLRLEAAHALCQDSLQKNLKNLTAAEHDALEFAAATGRVATHDQATLRSLLERLK